MTIESLEKSGLGMMLKRFIVVNRRGLTIFMHSILMMLAYLMAFTIRFDGIIPAEYLYRMGMTMSFMVICKMMVFQYFHLHHGIFRYAGMSDLVRLIKATTISNFIFMAVVVFMFHVWGFPRSVFVLDWLNTIILFGGIKMSVRLLHEKRGNGSRLRGGVSAKTLIIGAGDAGVLALRELRTNHALAHDIVGFIDDDATKHDLEIQGVPVLGAVSEIEKIIKDEDIDEVLIAMPSAGQKVIRDIVATCSSLDIRLRILPAMADLITGDISVQAIRDVQVEDLLCREPISFDASEVKADLLGKVILVSGAAGSIGSEIARQVALYLPRKLLLLDNAESPVFELVHDLRREFPDVGITPVICDVKDANGIENIFKCYKPDRVYHAAAYKHVPLMEAFPGQAVQNNIKGTRVLGEAAKRHKTERFVMVSTDKAVRPGNVMGATKRVCELLVASMNGGCTDFCAVRFGNVLGSNGSVIPTFRKQLEHGGPVTVTHPEMTRYFMTIPEAVALVLQCGAMSVNKNIFVLDMGAPVKIMDLAENMIRLSGLKVGEDIDIEITGLRPGEKIHEELVTYGEEIESTDVPKINILKKRDHFLAADCLANIVRSLEFYALRGNDEAVKSLLQGLIRLDQGVCENHLHPANNSTREAVIERWESMAKDQAGEGGSDGRHKILLVDHDPRAASIIKTMLRSRGCSVIEASCAYDAIETLAMDGEDVSVVIAEICLVDFSASELKKRIQDEGLSIKFVAMKSPGMEDDIQDHDFDFVLEKPFGHAELDEIFGS